MGSDHLYGEEYKMMANGSLNDVQSGLSAHDTIIGEMSELDGLFMGWSLP